MKLREVLRPVVRKVRRSRLYAWSRNLDVRRALRDLGGPEAKRLLVLPPIGRGNNGDQALLEAFLARQVGDIDVVVVEKDAYAWDIRTDASVHVVVLPHLVSGSPAARRGDLHRFKTLLSRSDRFVIIGADTADGDALGDSLAKIEFCVAADHPGRRVGLVSFSWRDAVAPTLTNAMRTMSRTTDVRIVPRDIRAHQNLTRASVERVVQGADLAFSLDDMQLPSADVADFCRDRSYVVINVSGHIARHVNQSADYARIAHRVRELGYRIVWMPHVFREQDDDLKALRNLRGVVDAEHDLAVTSALRPAEVRWVMSHAAFAITGRMHPGVLALSAGTPAIVLSTAGKVSGMLELFGLERFAAPARAGFSEAVIPLLEELNTDSDQIRQQVQARLSDVRALSLTNFME